MILETLNCRDHLRRIRTISLFSGCGGSDLALQQLGYNVVWANDIDEAACKTYEDNIGPVINEGNIADFSVADLPDADFLVGCYPCQGFTQGGKRDWGDEINLLYRQFDRILRGVLPRAFVVENVNGMHYGDNWQLLQNQLCRYRLAGYRVKWNVLDAQNFGVAQQRRRIFIVGVRSDMNFDYSFPEPRYGGDTGHRPVSQRKVLARMPRWPEGEFNDEPFHWYYLSRRRRHDWDEPSPCIVGHWRLKSSTMMMPPPFVTTVDTREVLRHRCSMSEVIHDQLGILPEVVTSAGVRPSYRGTLRRVGRYHRFEHKEGTT